MSLDDVLFGVIVGGVGLCAAYFRHEYIGWREHRAAVMRKQTSMRELHIDRSPEKSLIQFEASSILKTIADTERADSQTGLAKSHQGFRGNWP
jgi:hypothetical protein